MTSVKYTTATLLAAFVLTSTASAISYEAPSNYYNSATSTGSALKSQLRQIMTNGHDPTSYDDLKTAFKYTDTDPNNPNNVLLIYDRDSQTGNWNSGDFWDREHIWPKSLQGSGSNRNDSHALRPSTPKLNSTRGNKPFGGTYGQTSMGANGSFWYPGDQDAGDVARSLFYSATRYSHLSLKNGSASNNNMGDLSGLIRWHYLDTPDEFELRRNHAVYGGEVDSYKGYTYTNPKAQNNRNAYIDRPEYAWSVYMDQQNDTSLYFGSSANADGSSSKTVDLGTVIKGASSVNTSYTATLNKDGFDGTYYSVSTTSNLTSSVTGRYNAFAMDSSGSRDIHLNLDANTSQIGEQTGTVTVDNLDVTTQGGSGHGANDGDDTVTLALTVLDHSNASFSSSLDQDTLTIDFGYIEANKEFTETFDIFNYATSSFTADLDLDSITSSGDASAFDLDLNTFSNLAANDKATYTASINSAFSGPLQATYTLNLSDEDLPGATGSQTLSINLLANVAPIPEPTSLALLGLAGIITLSNRRRSL
ncbi:endonuclease [Planctomycetota bacterium]|nr:endonuclease [Planctomycetota bacterium]